MREETECGAKTRWRSFRRLCLKFQRANVGQRDSRGRRQKHLAVAIHHLTAFDSLHTFGKLSSVHRSSVLTEILDEKSPCFPIASNAAVLARHILRSFELQVHPDGFPATANHNFFAVHHERLIHSSVLIAHSRKN